MSSGRLPLCFALFALAALGPARAQEAGGAASSWTDPPARTAPEEVTREAPKETPKETPKTAAPAAAEPARQETVRTERTPAPSRPDPTQAGPTQAERRQEQIRRAVARSTAERAAEAAARAARTPRRSVVERRPPPRRFVEPVERPQRLAERATPRLRERQAVVSRSIRRPIYGYADPEPVGGLYGRYEAGPPAWSPRRWDEGGMADDRARRIAQARAAGYLVMRSRTYAFPDGTVVRRVSPGGPAGLYDIED